MNLIEALKALADGKAIRMKGDVNYYRMFSDGIRKFNRDGINVFGGPAPLDFIVANKLDLVSNTWEEAGPVGSSVLTAQEKEYLSAIVKPFRRKYKITICKRSFVDRPEYYISIELFTRPGQIETISLPWFKAEEKMYMDMERNKKYTPEELGL